MSTLSQVVAERDEAVEQVQYLKGILRDLLDHEFDCPGEDAKFTKSERAVLRMLKEGEGKIVRRAAMMGALYALRGESDLVVEKIIDVWICKIRRKLKRHSIETIWGVGWRLTPLNSGMRSA